MTRAVRGVTVCGVCVCVAGAEDEVLVRVREGAALELECALRVEQRAAWRREGGALPRELRPAGEAPARGGGLRARLRAPAAAAHMAGVYACAPGPGAQRLRLLVEPAAAPGAETTAAPATAAGAAAEPEPAPAADPESEAGPVVYYDLKGAVALNCSLDNPAKLAYVWYKNNTAIFKQAELKDRFKVTAGGATLELARALEEDWGNYSCALEPAGAAAAAAPAAPTMGWRLHARVYTRLPSINTNVVEGQKLRLICKVIGRPAPPVEWLYNESLSEPGAAAAPASEALGAGRVTLRDSEAGVRGGELLLDAARRSDAGSYVCAPLAPAPALAPGPFGHTALRVKDMYAALWPFLGICAEVLVLCAVILVYEKRRTKPELDDSDTDNHDQKKS